MQRQARIYIIHMELHDDQLGHYIGYTTRRLLSKRLEEHRNNPRQMHRRENIRNARLVKIAAIDERGDLQKEKWYQAAPEEILRAHVCPICKLFNAAGFTIQNERSQEAPPVSLPATGNLSDQWPANRGPE